MKKNNYSLKNEMAEARDNMKANYFSFSTGFHVFIFSCFRGINIFKLSV